ncbi:hypothetical protein niasHT_009606 [Heterodera trifolii]|uniref:C2H2-type domain-containing protein n=1 Tax=Heterodera trifolii TaxID=157864 RepID=A0ABD2LU37_9BILA
MHDPFTSTAHSDSNIDMSVGNAKNRTEQGDESSEFGEEDLANQYVIGVPIAFPLPCRFYAGRSLNTHAGFSKHLKKDHASQNTWHLAFSWHAMSTRRSRHNAKVHSRSRGTAPPQHANAVRQVRLRAPRLQEPVSPAQPADADQSGTTPTGTGARTDRMQHRLAQRSRTAGQSQTPAAHLIVSGQPEPLNNQTGPVVSMATKRTTTRSGSSGAAAPHPDLTTSATGVEKFDPGCHVLTTIFNAVKQQQHITTIWRRSKTVLIHKREHLRSFGKPIGDVVSCLQQSQLVPKRLMPAESEMKVPSRGDQTNAFGSIPHEVIFRSLKWSGLDNTTATPSDYCTTTTRPKYGRHTGGLTDDITIRAEPILHEFQFL